MVGRAMQCNARAAQASWDTVYLERLAEAVDAAARADAAALIMGPGARPNLIKARALTHSLSCPRAGSAELCLISGAMTIPRAHIEVRHRRGARASCVTVS